MSTTYKVVRGDTFESISRRVYGVSNEADTIAKANPGAIEPLIPGTTLTTPALPTAPRNLPSSTAYTDPDEVAILIDSQVFRFWESFTFSESIDGISTVTFTAPFEPELHEIFRPMSYKPVSVTIGGTSVFTGTLISSVPLVEGDRKSISISCYSLPGVLNDCTAPASLFPLEFNDQTLNTIAATLAKPFGIKVVFNVSPGARFERVALSPGSNMLGFLIELAGQRNLVISSTARGELSFDTPVSSGTSAADLVQDVSPLLSVTPAFNPQEFYSHITGVEPVSVVSSGSSYTVRNPLLSGVVRPYTYTIPDTLQSDIRAAVEAKAGRMIGNSISYSISVVGWRDAWGLIWKPNTLINLQAPHAMIYNRYRFLVKSVELEGTAKAKTASIILVPTGAYSGEIPESLPWD